MVEQVLANVAVRVVRLVVAPRSKHGRQNLSRLYSTTLRFGNTNISVFLKFCSVFLAFVRILAVSVSLTCVQGGPKSKPLSRTIIKSFENPSVWLVFPSVLGVK